MSAQPCGKVFPFVGPGQLAIDAQLERAWVDAALHSPARMAPGPLRSRRQSAPVEGMLVSDKP